MTTLEAWNPNVPSLVLSAEGSWTSAGVVHRSNWLSLCQEESNPVERLATLVANCLLEAQTPLHSLTQIIYSGGPGSLLGLRSMAALVESWQCLSHPDPIRLFRYSGLIWSAHVLLNRGTKIPFTVACPWRRDRWNCIRITRPVFGEANLEVVDTFPESSDDSPVFLLAQRKSWGQSPPSAQMVSEPSIADLPATLDFPEFLMPTKTVDLFNRQTNEYRKWEATRHRAP